MPFRQKRKEKYWLYDCPFGGNIAGWIWPLLDIRIHFNVERYDHAPSHRSINTALCSSARSGISARQLVVLQEWGTIPKLTKSILSLFLSSRNLETKEIFPCACRSPGATLLLQCVEFLIMLVHKSCRGVSTAIPSTSATLYSIRADQLVDSFQSKWLPVVLPDSRLEECCSLN
jgi:hypothetical protein